MSEELDIYVKIISFVVPGLGAALWWLTSNHFSLKERVKVLEIELAANAKSDEARGHNNEKIWDAISEINNTLKALEADVRVLTERISK